MQHDIGINLTAAVQGDKLCLPFFRELSTSVEGRMVDVVFWEGTYSPMFAHNSSGRSEQ